MEHKADIMKHSFFLLTVGITAVLPIASMIGWLNSRLFLASMHDAYIPMAPLTAICFVLLVIALLIVQFKPLSSSWVYLISTVIGLFLADVLLSKTGISFLDFEQKMVANPDMFGEVPVGRMSPITLFLFFLNISAVVFINSGDEKRKQISGWLITVAATITMVLLVGYLYNSPLLYGQTIIPVAFSTSLSFLFSSIALFYVLGTGYFPLNLFFGTATHVRLLRVFLPLTAFIFLTAGAVEMFLRENYAVNEALVLSISTLVSVIVIAFVTLYKAQNINRELEKTEAEKNRLISIIGASSDFVGIFNKNGHPEYLNHQLKRLSPADNQINFNSFFSEKDSERLKNEALPAAKVKGEWKGEAELCTATGQKIPVSLLIIYTNGKNGNSDWFSIIARDISELINANREMEQFAYTVSHDLKEPLRMVSNFMELLEKNYGSKLDEKAKKYIHFARDGSLRMTKMITDLLEYSRVVRTDGERTDVDLNAVLNDVKILYSARIEEKKATITSSELPTVSGIEVSLKMLFQNLISNAMKYQKEANYPEISISAEELPGFWKICIRDNGIGIDPDYFHTIFNLFSRLHTKDEYSGTGMGLALCRKVAEQHGGKIWVESKVGSGSSFYFTLAKE